MNCPKCQHEFADREFDSIPIQTCSSCNGLWFDRAKIKEYLGQALERSGQSPLLATLREIEPVPTTLVCPACQHQSLRSIKPHGVEIEQCTGCRGIFLDPGEIDLLSLQSISDAVDRRATAPTSFRLLSGSRASLVGDGIVDGVLEIVFCLLD